MIAGGLLGWEEIPNIWYSHNLVLYVTTLQIMCGLGNSRVNGILEYEIPEHVKKPTPTTPRLAL